MLLSPLGCNFVTLLISLLQPDLRRSLISLVTNYYEERGDLFWNRTLGGGFTKGNA